MKAPKLKFQTSKTPSKLNATSVLLLVALSLSTGCTSMTKPPVYSPSIPSLKVAPVTGRCEIENPKTPGQPANLPCILMLEQEWLAVLTELRAMCLALGHDEKTCGVATVAKSEVAK